MKKKIIFDMDGVITSEERYWDSASLVVWELLYNARYLGLDPEDGLPLFKADVTPAEIASIRKIILQDDQVIAFIKGRAVNSNWDLAFLTFGCQLALLLKVLLKKNPDCPKSWLGTGKSLETKHLNALAGLIPSLYGHWRPSFDAILGDWTGEARGAELMQKLSLLLPGPYRKLAENIFNPFSPLWKGVQDIFQEWYLGEDKYKNFYCREPAVSGKRGLIFDEKPVLAAEKIKDTLLQLLNKGWTLGIATGRPRNELYPPLKSYGIWGLFDPSSIITIDDVQKAEKSLKAQFQTAPSLGKPHPFSFLKAYWGRDFPEKNLIFPEIMRPMPGKCLVVGDSLADLVAAREMGAFFIGVASSGYSGAARLLENEDAGIVLPDITYIPSHIHLK